MKKVISVLSLALALMGCVSDDSNKAKEVNQTPQFGKPESTIPWNQPSDWEKTGKLGSMPGFEQPH
ncbi:MAG: membrane lipoprotein lipid attachment site-containing protein [Verrucomicrobia bacterium]|nr:membrane lipoprotein lipid attachment site-containing protein [Verrucomicrobiota bacterium]MBV8375577.1 membrane lipoprotein lipid attachment site-containing protein [Verrucomicrobiota bacterium]